MHPKPTILKSDDLKQDKGPGFWKFNNSLLEDSCYVNKLRENIYKYREKYTNVEDLGLKWDLIKMEIRGFTIKYCKIKMKKCKREELYVNDQFAILEEEKCFYEALYKSQSIDNDIFLASTFFKTQNITPLTQEEMESCEGLLSEDECLNAITEFKNNKSPRTDVTGSQ